MIIKHFYNIDNDVSYPGKYALYCKMSDDKTKLLIGAWFHHKILMPEKVDTFWGANTRNSNIGIDQATRFYIEFRCMIGLKFKDAV